MSQPALTRQVLVYENQNKPGMRVAAELQKFAAAHHFKIVTATDKATTRHLLQTQPVAVAVIDVGRESGEAPALLRSIGKGFTSLPLFVFNGFMIPGIAGKVREYGHVQYCEDPHELGHFLLLILADLTRKTKGIIEGIALTNVLELLNTEKLSGQVIVSSGTKKGVLFFNDGRLITASTGDPKNKTALAEMSAWEKVTVEIKEGQLPDPSASENAPRPAVVFEKPPAEKKAFQNPERGSGNIETLRLSRHGVKINVHIKTLHLALTEIADTLADSLLRTDIFLSADGCSLAGWNSHPLACSAFASITKCLLNSLQASNFPPLGNYYLLDLVDEHLLLIMVGAEMQWGMLLKGAKERLGFLLNIVMPKALNALAQALTEKYTV